MAEQVKSDHQKRFEETMHRVLTTPKPETKSLDPKRSENPSGPPQKTTEREVKEQ